MQCIITEKLGIGKDSLNGEKNKLQGEFSGKDITCDGNDSSSKYKVNAGSINTWSAYDKGNITITVQ